MVAGPFVASLETVHGNRRSHGSHGGHDHGFGGHGFVGHSHGRFSHGGLGGRRVGVVGMGVASEGVPMVAGPFVAFLDLMSRNKRGSSDNQNQTQEETRYQNGCRSGNI